MLAEMFQEANFADRYVTDRPEHRELVGPLTIELARQTLVFKELTPIRESQLP